MGACRASGIAISSLRRAVALGLVGWVANASDGSVRCVVEGPRDGLVALLEQLAEGPAGARIDAVAPTWGAATGGFQRFEIRSGGHPGD